MHTAVVLSRIDEKRAEELREIGIQTFTETFSEENSEENMRSYLAEKLSLAQLTTELRNSKSEFYFAEGYNLALGYLKLNMGDAQTEKIGENAVEIERIYVRKDFLGKNIGRILLQCAKSRALERNADFLWLGVWERNMRAISFYRKNGFEEFGKHTFMMGDDGQTDILMKLNLQH